MPRPKKKQSDNYFKAFPSVLRRLMNDYNITQQVLADYLEKSRQAIACYCDGSSSPDWETLVSIARFFSVSTDYLVGETSTKSPNTEIQAVCKFTGLREESITILQAMGNNAFPSTKGFIDSLLLSKNITYFEDRVERAVLAMKAFKETHFDEDGPIDFCTLQEMPSDEFSELWDRASKASKDREMHELEDLRNRKRITISFDDAEEFFTRRASNYLDGILSIFVSDSAYPERTNPVNLGELLERINGYANIQEAMNVNDP